ncbi:hypothetical protein DFH09DRAFT_1090805 [Mycena vulgaris]|nr:hypothetical protein DFH09DRAFT_1090805 [Mycena vulgaris]
MQRGSAAAIAQPPPRHLPPGDNPQPFTLSCVRLRYNPAVHSLVCPLLNLKPLRRLLELHNVPYVESDNVKRLRAQLKGFLTRLKNGKQPVDGRQSENGKM